MTFGHLIIIVTLLMMLCVNQCVYWIQPMDPSNNRDAGDLRRHRANHDDIVMYDQDRMHKGTIVAGIIT